MTAPDPAPPRPASRHPRRRAWWLVLPAVIAVPVGICWSLTASLSDRPGATPGPAGGGRPGPPPAAPRAEPVAWPDAPVAGDEAKRILLASNRQTLARIEAVEYYTATFRRHERVNGTLGPVIVSTLKVRNHPFAIYLKYQTVRPGKEVVYAEGHRDNKVLAHNGDWTRRLIPRLAVNPDSALALADSRHPVTEAGLLNLSRRLLRFRELDIGDAGATTALDRTTDAEGRAWLRSIHTHSDPHAGRPFTRVEILYHPDTQVPYQISSYDWPGPDHSGPLDLAEQYTYDDLRLDAPLGPIDFDPTNPAYAFMRF